MKQKSEFNHIWVARLYFFCAAILCFTGCKNSSRVDGYVNRAEIHSKYINGRHDEVVSTSASYLKANPSDTLVNSILAKSYYELGRYKEAEEQSSYNVVRGFVGKYEHYVFLGMVRSGLNDYKSAFKFYDSALVYIPDSYSALVARAHTYVKLGLTQKALIDLRSVALHDTEHCSEAYNDIALIHKSFSNSDSMLYYYRKALNAKQTSISASNIAIYFSDIGNSDSALYFFNQAVNLTPGNPEYLFYRATQYYVMNNNEAACLDCRKASEMGYKQAQANLKLYCK